MAAAYADTVPGQQNLEIEDIVRRERVRLLNFIRARVHDEDDAQDILQDVLWRLTEAYRGLETIERAAAWLFRVARNRITDLYRRTGPPRLHSVAARDTDAVMNLEDDLPDRSANPEQLVMRDAIWNEVETALQALPAAQREAFVLHELEGMSFRDMSEMTGETENALRLRKHYAMRSLRAQLEPLYDGTQIGRIR